MGKVEILTRKSQSARVVTDEVDKPKPWVHINEIRKNGLEYILKRKDGIVKSFKTPWENFNDSALDGIEWGSVVLIGGRPGSAKTSAVQQIIDEANFHNPDLSYCALQFQFEMTDRMTAVREICAGTGLTMRQVLSVDPDYILQEEDMAQMESLHRARKDDKIFQVNKPMTPESIYKTAHAFYKEQKTKNPDKELYLIGTIDHTVLVKRGASESNVLETLYALAEVLISLKREIPNSIWFPITQLNRSIEEPERRKDGSIGNFINGNDIFGSDAFQMAADVVMAFNRPDLLFIKKYGPEKWIVHKGLIVGHLVKNRFNGPGIIFFQERLKHFKIDAAPVPPKALM